MTMLMRWFAFWLLLVVFGLPQATSALDVVRKGRPMATVVVQPEEGGLLRQGRGKNADPDQQAAEVLVEWIAKMTGAELPIETEVPGNSIGIYVGRAAIKAGLKLDGIESPSREGLRVICDGRRILLAGQDATSTVKSACRLLEHWGCRYFMDHPLGEVFPTQETLTVDKLDIEAQPGLMYRRIWGSQWSGDTLWKIWNGNGGVPLSTGHAWGNYVSRKEFQQHPEYFHLRDGRREPSDWYCTSNPALRRAFSEGVMERIESGNQHPSLSPPDGRGYCECDACTAQDDPTSLEPSSSHVNISNRYVDFYDDVAGRVATKYPDTILNFYCYADYTQAPTSGIDLHPSLCAWIAPIRYCRFHRIGHPGCASRWQLQALIDGWAASAEKIGYRTYNYNLAECCVPFSKMSVWKHDIPWLKQRGCIGINLETLANWQIYGPHIYLSIRLAYNPEADADAIMDEYFQQFYGPRAGPWMQQYWGEIDQAFRGLRTHAGSFFAVHRVYTEVRLAHLRDLLDRAAAEVKTQPRCADRVAFASQGLRNAEQYVELRNLMNRGEFAAAKEAYENLLTRSENNRQQGQGNHYTVAYLKRFVGGAVDAAAAAVESPNRLVQVLPDQWKLEYDQTDDGQQRGFQRADFDDGCWTPVATYRDPLDAQGIADRQLVMWYRTTVDVPKATKNPVLFFIEVDGDAEVWVNGQPAGTSEKKRKPFQVDVHNSLRVGRNVIAVRVDHTVISELFLGGIIRPVLLIEED